MNSKSKILFAFSLLTLFSLTACGQDSSELPTSESYETHIGQFQSLAGVRAVNDDVTHLFETENGEIVYAYSQRYNLDDPQYYLGSDLEVYGMQRSYESVDKPILEVQRITLVEEDDDPEETEVNMVSYVDPSFGFRMSYPDNWEFNALRDSIQLLAPTPNEVEENYEPDYIIIAVQSSPVELGPELSLDDVQDEFEEYITNNYNLTGSKRSLVGPEGLAALHYETEGSDQLYFVPRGSELFEISFYNPSEDDELTTNTNTFLEILASFRVTPITGDDFTPNATLEEGAPQSDAILPEQEPVGELRSFVSSLYMFELSYPSNWYYGGVNGGYDFSDQPTTDEFYSPLVRLDINSEGSVSDAIDELAGTAELTVEFEGRYYRFSGPSSYFNIMRAMADSLKVAKIEDEE